MESFYAGKADRRILVHYDPVGEATPSTRCVVICHPVGQEYVRFYKALAVLAKNLAAGGFHCFRFDYYGTGDSFGDLPDVDSVNVWLQNLQEVVDEVTAGIDCTEICLVGVRFGAFVASAFSALRPVDALVLWNPVTKGSAYAGELQDYQRAFLSGSFAAVKNQGFAGVESLGFRYPAPLLESMRAVHLPDLDFNPATRVLLLEDRGAEKNGLAAALRQKNVSVRTAHTSVPGFWIKQQEQAAKGLVPVQEINLIVEWLQKN